MVNLTDTGGGLYLTPDASRPPTPLGPEIRLVSRDYLQVFGTRVLAGRGFQESDDAGRPHVMLVNQATVSSFFSGENPIGRQVFVGRDVVPWEIVGIVEDVRQYGLDRMPSSQYFVDLRQWTGISVVFPDQSVFCGARRRGPGIADPARARSGQGRSTPRRAPFNVTPMTALVDNNIARPRLYAVLLGVFALSGLDARVDRHLRRDGLHRDTADA